jgi:hypothetical protein
MLSIFHGQVWQKYYSANNNYSTILMEYRGKPKIVEDKSFNSWEEFYRCDIDKPPLEKDSDAFIDELCIKVHIGNAFRTTGGNYIYECSHIIRVDENPASKENAEKKLEVFFAEYENWLKHKKQVEEWENHISEKKWYEFWK